MSIPHTNLVKVVLLTDPVPAGKLTYGELAELRRDSKRLRWLFSGHTTEELAAFRDTNAPVPLTPQDECVSSLASWYYTCEQSISIIDDHIERHEESLNQTKEQA